MKLYIVYQECSDDNYPERLLVTTDECRVAPTVAAAYAECGVVNKENAENFWCDETSAGIDWRNHSQYRVWTDEVEIEEAPSELTYYADVRWMTDDVIAASEAGGVDLTEEEADEWWRKNESWFSNRLVELGNEMLYDIDWKQAAADFRLRKT